MSNQKLLIKKIEGAIMSNKKQTKAVSTKLLSKTAVAVVAANEKEEKDNTNLISEIDALKSTLKVAEKNIEKLTFENESLLDRLQNSIDTKEYKKNVLYTSLRFNDKVVEHHYNVKEFYVDSKNCHDQKYNRMYSLLEKDVMNCDIYFEADYETYKHNLYNNSIKKHNKLQLRFEDIIQ